MVTDAGLTFGNSVVILGRVGISGSTPGLSAGMSLGAMGHHGTGHGRVVQDGIVMIGGQVVGVTMMTMTMLGRIQIG
jgi:alkylation response protein AidB-like acyl-CoA dehydrogenase